MIYFISKNIDRSAIGKDIVLTGINKVKEDLKSIAEISLDCETTGISPLNDKIISLQFGTKEGNQYVVDTRDYDISELKDLLEDNNHTFIGHNIKFDYNMLKQYGIVLKQIYDTMVADMVLYTDVYSQSYIMQHKRFSLASVYKHHTGNEIDKRTRKSFITVKDKAYNYDQIKYAALDVYYPFEIKDKQIELIKRYQLEECLKLENEVVLVLGDIEYNGIQIDTSKWLHTVNKYKIRATETELRLDEELLKQPTALKYKKIATQLSLFDKQTDNRTTIVNWNSDQQVYEILSTIFNIYPTDKDGKPSSGAEAIFLLQDKHPFTELLLKFREETKVVTSFGEDYIKKYVDKDSRIRTNFNQIIGTGRVSSRNPNLQQVKNFDPSDPDSGDFRKSFCVTDNKLLSTADYSGQEARIMADLAMDKNYINFFNENGGDPHSFVATRMFSAAFKKEFIVSKTQNSEYRQKGKILNFSISFGASAYTMSKRLKISIEEAQGLIDAFYEGFPALKTFFDKARQFGIKFGYIRTNDITKRIRWFSTKWRRYQELKDIRIRGKSENSELMRIKGGIEREAQNTRIQGSAADMTKYALIYIRRELIKANILPLYNAPVKIVLTVHDEIVIEADKDLINHWSKVQKDCMEEAGRLICKRVNIIADTKISDHWEH